MYLAKTDKWYLERVIWLLAGLFTLASLGLGYFVSPYWFILTLLVGINQIVLSLTGFCPMTVILDKAGCHSRIS
ncbi:MAG TPA: DUF2892 domain-containing protein [Leptospiraceae bacterium]|nr:DUF2892 domain-containing protein [Leptospiraceae bacterium]HMW06797.1 DUF2892 domain-containing protein [Leptospiraceae bacterium]HMX32187.1 DUF2892 domain-containing protein [Leptospiraceae bacterium]HMY32257.1 DUF2892 domain-containing protein [Leptospiraceae bacterium]HMZ63946.1 DUF2892 domain-containing protein [Leptospiraceae bacterium]